VPFLANHQHSVDEKPQQWNMGSKSAKPIMALFQMGGAHIYFLLPGLRAKKSCFDYHNGANLSSNF